MGQFILSKKTVKNETKTKKKLNFLVCNVFASYSTKSIVRISLTLAHLNDDYQLLEAHTDAQKRSHDIFAIMKNAFGKRYGTKLIQEAKKIYQKFAGTLIEDQYQKTRRIIGGPERISSLMDFVICDITRNQSP